MRDVTFDADSCTVQHVQQIHWTPLQIICAFIVLFVLSLVLMGTIVDVFNIRSFKRHADVTVEPFWHMFFMSFSFKQNLKNLNYVSIIPGHLEKSILAQNSDSAFLLPRVIKSINGIKFLLVTWLIIANTFIFGGIYRVFHVFTNSHEASYSFTKTWFQFILNAWFIITNCFLTLSGLLMTYSLLPKLHETKGSFDYISLLSHRCIRLFPPIVGALCLYLIWPIAVINITSQPLSPHLANEASRTLNSCNNWWSSLLFISNFMPIESSCIPSSFAISTEFQFCILAPLLVVIFYRRASVGYRLVIISTLASTISAAIIRLTDNQPATLLPSSLTNLK